MFIYISDCALGYFLSEDYKFDLKDSLSTFIVSLADRAKVLDTSKWQDFTYAIINNMIMNFWYCIEDDTYNLCLPNDDDICRCYYDFAEVGSVKVENLILNNPSVDKDFALSRYYMWKRGNLEKF